MLYILILLILILSIRTFLSHLQSWQIREYRFDRMRAYLRTKDGRKSIWNLWFFKGLLPRPKFSGRIFIIMGITILIHLFIPIALIRIVIQQNPEFFSGVILGSFLICNQETISCWFKILNIFFQTNFVLILSIFFLLINERLIWLTTFFAVKISAFPTLIAKKILFHQAKKIRENGDQNIIAIAITGSYGKSSTKQLLVHLLTQEFGSKNILYNPENNNTEVAIARLMKNNKQFFTESVGVPLVGTQKWAGTSPAPTQTQKFLIIEIGAYKKGEIHTACQFVQPQISLITGLTPQHLDLFGTEKKLELAKLEIAQNASDKIFYNQDSPWLEKAINQNLSLIQQPPNWTSKSPQLKQIIPSSTKTQIKNIQDHIDHTTFNLFGENFTLPWPGTHFTQNALLALLIAKSLKISEKNLTQHLRSLPPLPKALSLQKRKNQATIIKDLYSSNPQGVLAAINHLKNFSGKKHIIMNPLLELGNKSTKIHQEIFQKISEIENTHLYTFKEDHQEIAQEILGKNFHKLHPENSLEILKHISQNLGENDAVLLEGRLPENIIKIF